MDARLIEAADRHARMWRGSESGDIRVGSDAHKHLFCNMLLDTFNPYKPAVIDWPPLGARFHGGRLATDAPDSPHRLVGRITADLYFGHADQDQGMPLEDIARLDEALKKELDVIVDNTNLNPKQRKPILDKAKEAGYSDIQLWFLDVPLEVCLQRNAARERTVPDDIVANMFMELNRSGRPQRTEGRTVLIRPGKDKDDFRFFFPQS